MRFRDDPSPRSWRLLSSRERQRRLSELRRLQRLQVERDVQRLLRHLNPG